MFVLQSRPGTAVRVKDSVLQCQTKFFYLTQPRLRFETETSIVTKVGLSEAVNAQFTHTFGSYVFCYVFGDQIGTMRMSGISFACDCVDGTNRKHGAESMLLWYRRYRASKRRTPVQIMLGDTAIEGLMISMDINSVEPGTNLASWDAVIRVLPSDQFDESDLVPLLPPGVVADPSPLLPPGVTVEPPLATPEPGVFPPAPAVPPLVFPPTPPGLSPPVGLFPPTPPGLFDPPSVVFPDTPPGLYDSPQGVAPPDFTPLFPPDGSVDGIPVDLVDFSEASTDDPGTIFLPPITPNPFSVWPPMVLRTPPNFAYSPEN